MSTSLSLWLGLCISCLPGELSLLDNVLTNVFICWVRYPKEMVYFCLQYCLFTHLLFTNSCLFMFFLILMTCSFAPLFNEDGLLPWTKCDEWWNTEKCRTPLDLINASKNLKISNNGTVSSTEEYWKWVWIWFHYFLLCFIFNLIQKKSTPSRISITCFSLMNSKNFWKFSERLQW